MTAAAGYGRWNAGPSIRRRCLAWPAAMNFTWPQRWPLLGPQGLRGYSAEAAWQDLITGCRVAGRLPVEGFPAARFVVPVRSLRCVIVDTAPWLPAPRWREALRLQSIMEI